MALNEPSSSSKSTPRRPWTVLTITGALSVFAMISFLTASPAHGLSSGHVFDKRMLSVNTKVLDEAAEEILSGAHGQILQKRGKASPGKSNADLEWIRLRLGTKSPYPHEDKPEGSLDDVPDGYELVQLHLICRHGTRYPSASDSVAYKKLTERLSNTTVPGYEWIRNWSSETWYPPSRGNLLATRGDADLYEIGRRFAKRYESFLDQYPYSPNNYEFRSSHKSRCSQSAYGFSLGFFEDRLVSDEEPHRSKSGRHLDAPPSQPIHIYTVPQGLDQEMAVEDSCPKYLNEVADQPAVGKQVKLYQDSFIPVLAQNLSTTFGVNFTAKDASRIYQMCGFEASIYDDVTTWCQMLLPIAGKNDKKGNHGQDKSRQDNFIKLEIAGDLDDFYTHGPGVPFNQEMGCKLGTSLMQSIELALSSGPDAIGDGADGGSTDLYRGHLKFGHSETIMFFSTYLGLYNRTGVVLTADMTPDQYAKREFRSSLFAPFAANMAFEVFQPKASGSNKIHRRRLNRRAASDPQGLVRLLVNEMPLPIPGCDGAMFCEWSKFKSILIQRGAGCDFESCCGTVPPISGKTSQLSVTFAANATCPSTTPVVP
ncbi:histidine phosphatase superfamily [Gamsiella multidivaricata]|uniref:histidine phosphatase superfamily n=1 Tax=Gamsiella multidivaricata TaxID=101098 RepID=UPI00221FBD83|nr:histidine phosphatase superfamily [Gamsiella multidivaricata]KAG0363810.1 hypothetical protein BGZ54_008012 [Gamsiella multidivaricata]KAI7832305.1 histidine phosphatase superfamily [Gamsiella multidivaricata]